MSTPTRSTVDDALARDRLGAPSIIAFAMTAAAPLMVIGGVVTVGWATVSAETGITGYPLAFVLIAAVLGLFSIGYMAMSKRINNTGAFYSYVAHGAGKPFGVAAAFIAFAAYNLLQFGLYGIFGATLNGFLDTKFGIDIPWWVLSLAAWGIVAALGMLRVDINGGVLLTIVAAEIIVVIIFDAVFLANPAPGGYSLSTFAPDNLFLPGVGAILVTIFTAFVGFEAAAVYSEESRNRVRTVPIATYLALAVMVVFYAITAWAIAVTVGDDNLIATAGQQQSDMMFGLAAQRLGGAFIADIGIILLITSAFAAMLSYHNTVARYTFALARERVLPKILARTGLKSGAPKNASLLQSVLAVAVIAVYAATEWDPLVHLFFWLGMTGGFGVLVLVAATAISIVCYFIKNGGTENIGTRYLAPGAAALILATIVYFAIDSYASLVTMNPDDPWWLFPSAYAVIAVIGITWALILKATKPDDYARLGAATHTSPDNTVAPELTGDRA
ncbi:MAG: APC family permease [Stackebrandtia sp.]